MSSQKILAIDSDFETLFSLSQWLVDEGYQMFTAQDGEEGLEKVKAENPDLVIIEPLLAKLHGFELAKIIVNDFGNRIPVIILTKYYRDEHFRTEALHKTGVAAYLNKPAQKADLLAAIQKHIPTPKKIMPKYPSLEKDKKKSGAAFPLISKITAPTTDQNSQPDSFQTDLDEQWDNFLDSLSPKNGSASPNKSGDDIDLILKNVLADFEDSKSILSFPPQSEELPEESEDKTEDLKEIYTFPEIRETKNERDSGKLFLFPLSRKRTRMLAGLLGFFISVGALYIIFASNNPYQIDYPEQYKLHTNTSTQSKPKPQIPKTAASQPNISPKPAVLPKQEIIEPAATEEYVTLQPIAPENGLIQQESETQPLQKIDSQSDSSEKQIETPLVSEGEVVPGNSQSHLSAGDLIPISSVDTPPVLIRRVNPVYPVSANNLGIEGTVILNLLISETGDVLDSRVLRGVKEAPSFQEECLKATGQWKYKPAEKEGVRVKVWKTVSIVFKRGE